MSIWCRIYRNYLGVTYEQIFELLGMLYFMKLITNVDLESKSNYVIKPYKVNNMKK